MGAFLHQVIRYVDVSHFVAFLIFMFLFFYGFLFIFLFLYFF